MRTRTIASDLPAVSVVGVGDVSPAIAALRGIDYRDFLRALDDAIELGLTLFDVAAEEDAEKFVGETIRSHRARDRVVATSRVNTTDPRELQIQVERSLRAFRLDALPLVQLPISRAQLATTAWPELAGTCARLIREGKVIAWAAIPDASFAVEPVAPPPNIDAGFSMTRGGLFIPDVAAPAAPAGPPRTFGEPFAAIVVALSLSDRASEAIVARAIEDKLPVLARRPLAGGTLGGLLGPGAKLALHDDRRGLDLEAVAVQIAKLGALVERTPPAASTTVNVPRVVDPLAFSVAELAIRWVIDHAGITAALPRLHRREHVPEAIACAAARPLPPSTTEQIFSILEE
ncbi:MAG: aldo/keto reductase [Proteobacteria bacterium]|nr:aldo/keto reductase [Pseudomonadota bacterium]